MPLKNKPFRELKTRYSLLKVMTGSDLSRRRLPFMSISASRPGPNIWLTACMHGDEVGGMVVIQEVFKRMKRLLSRGSVYAFPLLNPMGFETVSRHISPSREDLNRSFPGDPTGSLGERIANQVFNSIMNTHPDLLIDLHSDWRQSIPYILLDPRPSGQSANLYDQVSEICESTGFYMVEDRELIQTSLTHNLMINGVPAVTFELGESYVVNESHIQRGVMAVMNALGHMDMINVSGDNLITQVPAMIRETGVLSYSDLLCTKSGIIRFLAKPGDLTRKGQPVMKVYNAFGKLQETLLAKDDSVVLGNADTAVAYPGMIAMAFGVIRESGK